ncbi:HNH endonuclease [Chitinophaga polysaccharea]|uniref:HNH endonuclease n=2 Tax=Chitinophaga polysaccharea TaxID=1293035 RepID=A0A561PQB3_9BACT|nr:HNH endonuclease [Chitinophaga polysaccharea]
MIDSKSDQDFSQEVSCSYKGERYSVRDSGQVLRHSPTSKRLRSTDNKWSFGKPNDRQGYLQIASVPIHRIVATAFHGLPPTEDYVVDHIDINKRNNRPENLRCVSLQYRPRSFIWLLCLRSAHITNIKMEVMVIMQAIPFLVNILIHVPEFIQASFIKILKHCKYMKILMLISLINFFSSCSLEGSKFVRKEIDNKDISIKWYYYSYITNNSPDFVVVEKNGKKKEIFKATWTVLNVTLKDHNIILKTLGPSKSTVFTKHVEEEVFGYKITLDTTGNYMETRLIPDGKKERW